MKIFLCTLLFPLSLLAEQGSVETAVHQEIEKLVKRECDSCSVKIDFPDAIKELSGETVSSVDVDQYRGRANALIQTNKQTKKIPLSVRWFDKVVIAQKNIRHGSLISESDVKVIEKDVTFNKAAYVGDVSKVIGMVGKRKYVRGQIIDENYIKKANVVRYGQPIKINLSSGQLSMTVSGKAKGVGAVGDIIPVQINKTKKKVMAKIIDNSTARME